MPQAKVAFQYPGFRYFMTARFLVTASSEMQSVAIGWQVYNLTHRARDLGLVGLSPFLPRILLFLLAGPTAHPPTRPPPPPAIPPTACRACAFCKPATPPFRWSPSCC